ncbi:hypothetical protein PCL_04396 [Purpureocillium lilacinum]|uniref:Cation diffusion facilitator family metal ion transporter n=1 Tax=Purpureocillium lilacinum TaxID=33203 RepID=A0A2U3DYC6_PURLI|nr:hypothetical protein PCL_04396 [Purpureocillium lilacinum]
MACAKISRKQRLIATIAISFSFFVAELIAGFYTHSLALVADAFHYLSDLAGFVVALVAVVVSERVEPPPKQYTFGWQRATLLGAFFNGVFLLALGVSILVQAIERFSHITPVEDPRLVLIIGCVGFGLNVIVMSFLHEHDHGHGHGHGREEGHGHSRELDIEEEEMVLHRNDFKSAAQATTSHHEHKHNIAKPSRSGRDLGMLGVLIHVVGDAINNIGVIISAVVIWKAEGEGRYYIDPAISVFIAIMIFLTAIPLTKRSGSILLQIAPGGIDLEDVKYDIESIPGVDSVHELHIWRLDQHKSVATAHVVVDDRTVENFGEKAKVIMECLHAYGIHSVTLQPEVLPPCDNETTIVRSVYTDGGPAQVKKRVRQRCQLCKLTGRGSGILPLSNIPLLG